ncbi:MAG TPA: hypothetical protein P5160_03310 [Candidatus Omnitrophota bacterium]|jgi:hypothetical protein|nr:hypothetical protein [Candidatus Omnitrophota bacterium]
MKERSSDYILTILIVFFALALFSFAGYLLLSSKTVYSDYYNDTFEFSMKYPQGWTMSESREIPAIVVMVATPLRDALDTFQENVSVTVTDLKRKPGVTLDQFTKITLEQTMGMFKDGIYVESSRMDRLGGKPGYRFIWGMRPPKGMETEAGSTLKYFHIWAFYKDFAYMFTYAGQESQFDLYLPQVKAMVRSIKFGKRNP